MNEGMKTRWVATCANQGGGSSRIQTLAWVPPQCPGKQGSCLTAAASGLYVLGLPWEMRWVRQNTEIPVRQPQKATCQTQCGCSIVTWVQ